MIAEGLSEDEAKEKAPIINEAREMLRLWEANDAETRELWQRMNRWVYAGFDETYTKLSGLISTKYTMNQTLTLLAAMKCCVA